MPARNSEEANMDNDDAPVGRILTRREALLLLSASGAALLTGSGFFHGLSVAGATLPPSCVARPEQTEGPYFVDDRVRARAPYAGRGARTTRNPDDEIFAKGGEQLLLDPKPTRDGYAASFTVGLQLD